MSSRQLQVDAVIVESTYGGKSHPNRKREESRLITQVDDCLADGGSVLFPAFAIGRSQELLLILSWAMEVGTLPRVPVYVDGLVRHVCGVYTRHEELLTPWLRRRIATHGHPFFQPPVEPIWQPKTRMSIVQRAEPKIIVSSSGMLTGGPSAMYARMMAPNPQNYIAITGYQDEESPGRAVQQLARDGGGTLRLPDGAVPLRCQVGTYALSAHADTGQLCDFVRRSGATDVMLVHGDASARTALHTALGQGAIHLPQLGETIALGKPPVVAPFSLAPASAMCVSSDLSAIARALLDEHGPGASYSIQELVRAAGHNSSSINGEVLEALAEQVTAMGSPFRQSRTARWRYLIAIGPGGALLCKGERRPRKVRPGAVPGLPTTQQVEALLDEVIPVAERPYKRGVHLAQGRMVLSWYYFPRQMAPKYAEVVQAVADQTGWQIEIRDHVHQQALMDAAMEVIPAFWRLSKRPGLHLDKRLVKLSVSLEAVETWAEEEAKRLFQERTGYSLEIVMGVPATTRQPKQAAAADRFWPKSGTRRMGAVGTSLRLEVCRE